MEYLENVHYQPYPKSGRLFENLNLDHDTLIHILRQIISREESSQTIVYCYIVDTIKNHSGRFMQTGSGPNFQGDFITLCTCKHKMRTYNTVNSWKGMWVAGFIGINVCEQGNALVYLMKISHTFASHHRLWISEEIPDSAKQAKLANLHKFGDLFKPKATNLNKFGNPSHPQDISLEELSAQFNPENYESPCEDHVHCEIGECDEEKNWCNDIDYVNHRSGRRAILLVGDPEYSFLWDEPKIFYPSHFPKLFQGEKISNINDLLGIY